MNNERAQRGGKASSSALQRRSELVFLFFFLCRSCTQLPPRGFCFQTLSLPTTPLWCGGMQIRSASACETRPEPQTEPTPPASPRRHPAEVLQAPSSPSTPPCLGGWQTLQHVEWRAVAREEALRFATFHLVVSFAECSIIPVRPPAAQSASQTVELLSLFGRGLGANATESFAWAPLHICRR